jgi:hypothetical protein
MTTRSRSSLRSPRLALITVAMTACGTASGDLTPSESTTTLMLRWEHWFTLDWSVEREPGGADRVRGYVTNEYGSPAESVPHLPAADHYRVSVWDFSFVESASLTR